MSLSAQTPKPKIWINTFVIRISLRGSKCLFFFRILLSWWTYSQQGIPWVHGNQWDPLLSHWGLKHYPFKFDNYDNHLATIVKIFHRGLWHLPIKYVNHHNHLATIVKISHWGLKHTPIKYENYHHHLATIIKISHWGLKHYPNLPIIESPGNVSRATPCTMLMTGISLLSTSSLENLQFLVRWKEN